MPDEPRKGDGSSGPGELLLLPTSITYERIVWTDQTENVALVIATKTGKYIVSFGPFEFVAFVIDALNAAKHYVLDPLRKGS